MMRLEYESTVVHGAAGADKSAGAGGKIHWSLLAFSDSTANRWHMLMYVAYVDIQVEKPSTNYNSYFSGVQE